MIEVKRIGLDGLTRADVEALLTRCADDPYGWEFKDVLEALRESRFAAYRWSGDFNGLMLVKVNAYPGGKELYLWHLSGKGFIKNMAAVHARTVELARSLGCRWMSTSAQRRGLQKFYARFAQRESLDYMMEV